MNHGRGERTDHPPIFDPTKLCQKNRIYRLTGTKAISINLRSLRRRLHKEKIKEKKEWGARCVAEGRRERTHAWKFFLSEVRESMIGRTSKAKDKEEFFEVHY